MSDDGLTQLFTVQFKTLLELKLQQKMSLLRGYVDEGTHTGSRLASPINQVAAIQMRTPAGRFAPKERIPNSYTRRWVSPIDKEGDQYVDNFDQLKTPIDPKSKLVESAAAGVARLFDDEIIRAMTATSTIGEDAGSLTTEAWDTTNFQVAADFGASASVGLTVAKLNEARRILEHYHAFDFDAEACLVIGSKQHSDLRNQAQVTNSEFNSNGGVLVDGVVKRYMGFHIVVSERLPTITDKNSNANTRSCRVFTKSGMYLGLWQDVKTEVLRRPDLSSNPWDINTMVSFGATRTQLGKVIEVCAADTSGADITP